MGDEPAAAGGGDLGPRPYELLAAALAECTAMTVRWFARQRGWPCDHVEVAVEHVKKSVPGRTGPIDVFEKTVAIVGPRLTAEQRNALLNVAGKCPVHRTLEGTSLIATTAATPKAGSPDQGYAPGP